MSKSHEHGQAKELQTIRVYCFLDLQEDTLLDWKAAKSERTLAISVATIFPLKCHAVFEEIGVQADAHRYILLCYIQIDLYRILVNILSPVHIL